MAFGELERGQRQMWLVGRTRAVRHARLGTGAMPPVAVRHLGALKGWVLGAPFAMALQVEVFAMQQGFG